MFELISLSIALLGIGFACGYGVRELKSQRRRAAAREHFRRQEQKRYDHPNDDWISPASGLSDRIGAAVVPGRSGQYRKQSLIERYEADMRLPDLCLASGDGDKVSHSSTTDSLFGRPPTQNRNCG
jgi:hypothetical protein